MHDSLKLPPGGGRHVSFMAALIALLFFYPWVTVRPVLALLSNVLIVATGAYEVSGFRRHFNLLLALGGLHLVTMGAWVHREHPVLLLVSTGLLALFYATTVCIVLRQILRPQVVDLGTICNAVSLYLLLGFLWASLYSMVLAVQPDALVRFAMDGGSADTTYFSFVTLCTIGYGDLTPRHGLMRPLAILEGITGLFYMAVLVARLVSLFGQEGQLQASAEPASERAS